MEYTLTLISGKEYRINQEEYNSLLGGVGMIFLKRLGVTLNTSSISVIEPEHMNSTAKVDRNKQQLGVAPDGKQIEKHYGIWYYQHSNNEYQYNDDGLCVLKYTGPALVPTPEEYQAHFQHIDPSEWVPLLVSKSEPGTFVLESKRTSTGGLTKIGAPMEIEEKKEEEPEWCEEHQGFAGGCEMHHQKYEEADE